MRSVCSLARFQVRQLLGLPRPYLVVLVVFCLLSLVLRDANTYLAETGQQVQAMEFVIFALGSSIQIILFGGLLLLISDAPFLHEGLSYRLIRTDRVRWLLGQTLACAIICALYLAVIAALFPLLFPGRVFFQNEWSRPARIASMVPMGTMAIGIQAGFGISMKVLENGTPWGMLLYAFLFGFLLYTLLCVMLIVCNLRFRSLVGPLVVTGWMLLWYAVGSIPAVSWLRYLSPFHLASLNEHTFQTGDTLYSLLFFLVTGAAFWLLALRETKGTDFIARHRAE